MKSAVCDRDGYNSTHPALPAYQVNGEILSLVEGSMEVSALPVLRPLRLGELLDQAVRLYRRNFLSFVGMIALGYIPYAVIQVASSALSVYSAQDIRTDPQSIFTSAPYWLSILGSLFSVLIYVIFVGGLGTAALTNAISRNYLGQKTGILDTYRQLGSSWVKLLLTLLLFSLLGVVAFIWTMVPCVGWVTGPGLLVFMGGVVGQLIAPIVVVEKLDGNQAISRAWHLARRRFWWLVGFAVVFYLFNLLVVSGPTALISYFAAMLLGQGGALQGASLISTLISSVAGSLIYLLVLPIQLTAWTLVYFDLRVRTEGFDLALLTLNPSENAITDMASLPTTAPTQGWLNGEDIGKFVAITLVIGGIYALLAGLLAVIVSSLGSRGGL
jgi:hypothetical protein